MARRNVRYIVFEGQSVYLVTGRVHKGVHCKVIVTDKRFFIREGSFTNAVRKASNETDTDGDVPKH